MFTVGHVFGEIVGAWCGRGEPARLGVDVPATSDLLEVALARCMAVGLDVQPAPVDPVRHLIVPDGDGTRTLERRSVYGLCSLDSVQAAMLAMIDHVRAREGAGRIWFCRRPSYLNRRGENGDGCVMTRLEGRESEFPDPPVFTPTGDGSRRVVIGAYYFHAPAVQDCTSFDGGACMHAVFVPSCGPCRKREWVSRAPAVADGLEAWAARHAACPPSLSVVDPLDVKHDGATLRELVRIDEVRQRGELPPNEFKLFTVTQREAISAHWSAQLRAKVAASAAAEVQRDRGRVACDPRDPIDLED